MFDHTSRERGMWRGWTNTGRCLEVVWWRPFSGRFKLGANVSSFSESGRHLQVALGWLQAFIPLGESPEYEWNEETPSWGAMIHSDPDGFNVILHWGRRCKVIDNPFRIQRLSWDYLASDGQWRSLMGPYVSREDRKALKLRFPYRYVLQSREEQEVIATITQERTMLGRRFLHRLGWPKQKQTSIDIEFSAEVGERAGSWKGGCIGCSYTALPHETPEQTLRRMERERKF